MSSSTKKRKKNPQVKGKSGKAAAQTNPTRWERFWSRIKGAGIARQAVMALSALLFVFSFSPLAAGVWTDGIVPPACIALFFFTAAYFWDSIMGETRLWARIGYIAVAVVVSAGIVLMSVVSGMMLSASLRTVPEDKTRVTVVVLGCLVIDDRPSLMLQDRLDAAAEYLLSNPEACCVVTGGQGHNEDYPEAVIMRDYLVEKGVSPSRIVVEQESTSTYENLVNASALIEKYNCHEEIVIATDRFHQYRARLAAEELGMTSYCINSETRWYLSMQYWFREIVGICYIAAFGNR